MPPRKNLQEYFDDGNLDLSLSDLQDVPVRDIAAIPKATTLDLSSNRIATLPKTFASSLTHLVKLDLCQNQLTELPDNFGLLVHLKHLDLYSNKLTSLPLSFGSLKALRWLDLKQNPLMPKLAEIAGPCLDASQCQTCAKKVVSNFAAMQAQVDAERQRRQEQRQKQQEINEQKAQAQKAEQQQQKKKKKKSQNNAEHKEDIIENGTSFTDEENKTVESQDQKNTHKSVISSKNKSSFGQITSALSLVLKLIVITTLFITFVMFMLSLLDTNTYNIAQHKLNIVTQSIRKRLPTTVVKQLDVYVAFIKNIHVLILKRLQTFCVTAFEQLQVTYVDISNNQNFKHYMQTVNSGWHFLWIKISELYRTATSLVH